MIKNFNKKISVKPILYVVLVLLAIGCAILAYSRHRAGL